MLSEYVNFVLGEALSYEDYLKRYTEINKELDDASADLKKISGSKKTSMGLTPDEVKNDPKYKKAEMRYKVAFNKLRDFNGSKEYKDHMKRRNKESRANRFKK